MGGNALKNTTTRRYAAREFAHAQRHVNNLLAWMLPRVSYRQLLAYEDKESFGDMDVLIESECLPPNWPEVVAAAFGSTESVKNGNVLSLNFNDLQVDLIATPAAQMETSYHYFNYNDLGNLLGRVAHSMGFKLGHDGLSYSWRDGTYNFRTDVICTDWETILEFLGYDAATYYAGFPTLLSIFEFVASGKFFRPEIYALENRNHASRVRDAKRKTYMEFVAWVDRRSVAPSERPDKRAFVVRAFSLIPGFEETFNRVHREWAEALLFKARYNGTRVGELLGITRKDLGAFMQHMKATHGEHLQGTVLALNPNVIDRWVRHFYDRYVGAPADKMIDGVVIKGERNA